MNKKAIYTILGISIIGVIAFVVFRRRKKSSSSEPIAQTNNTSVIDSIFSTKDADTKFIEDKIESAKKNVLSFYQKNGNVLKDIKSGENISLDATKSAYFMITKDILKVMNSTSSSKAKEVAESYLNNYLPNYFDKSIYNVNAIWYKGILAKL
jgi:LPXTG-motif cell wall-anchored protein